MSRKQLKINGSNFENYLFPVFLLQIYSANLRKEIFAFENVDLKHELHFLLFNYFIINNFLMLYEN